MVAAVGVIPLIYKAEGEDYLPGRAIKQQPEGNSFVMEERYIRHRQANKQEHQTAS